VNHSKLKEQKTELLLVKSLKSKYKKAIEGQKKTRRAFEDLDASVDEVSSQQWREEERKAMEFRGEYLRVYEVQMDKGESVSFLTKYHSLSYYFSPLPWRNQTPTIPE
jgi:hypothetical protein